MSENWILPQIIGQLEPRSKTKICTKYFSFTYAHVYVSANRNCDIRSVNFHCTDSSQTSCQLNYDSTWTEFTKINLEYLVSGFYPSQLWKTFRFLTNTIKKLVCNWIFWHTILQFIDYEVYPITGKSLRLWYIHRYSRLWRTPKFFG